MSADKSNFAHMVFFGVFVCLVFVLLVKYWTIGPDYFFTFRPIIMSFFQGETRLYDSNSLGFYNAPWAVFILLPTVLLPIRYGQALLLIVSLLGLLFSSFVVVEDGNDKFNIIIVVLALTNLHTFDLLIRGNIDGILVWGIGLAWLAVKRRKPLLLGIGLWLLLLKPINIILTILVFIKMTWSWSNRDKITTSAPLAVTLILSFPIFGFNWPVRYVTAIRENPPLTYLQTSIWRAFEFLGFQKHLSLWLFVAIIIIFGVVISRMKSADQTTLALALSANLVFSPYTLGSHYVLLIPVFVILVQKYKMMLAVWVLTLTPLVRLFFGFEIAWIDIFYPIALMIGTICIIVKNRERANPNSTRLGFASG